MALFQLHILDYNYSSWSMRAGVLLRLCGADFSETPCSAPQLDNAELLRVSPSGLLPVLVHGDLKVWDSLAIAEYLAEEFPALALWPRDRVARALARSASCEMHSGFTALRQQLPMNIRAHYPGFARSLDADTQVKRVQALWSELRARCGQPGDYLCGDFGIVDAMFAPVVMRFRSYDVRLDGVCAAYADAVVHHPAVLGWLEKVRSDTVSRPAFEYVRT
jgi:glutathione S-transferase